MFNLRQACISMSSEKEESSVFLMIDYNTWIAMLPTLYIYSLPETMVFGVDQVVPCVYKICLLLNRATHGIRNAFGQMSMADLHGKVRWQARLKGRGKYRTHSSSSTTPWIQGFPWFDLWRMPMPIPHAIPRHFIVDPGRDVRTGSISKAKPRKIEIPVFQLRVTD